ncbi:hypothetical protein DEO72_LG1g3141 [Vigna unguiculata]|uniref:Uncharacterized protein n=1 Tax=Vigna unguiculata TaxID=3917 RepID=A0A4D6KW10_VIGUN|nr:hypothetical protein DEO72_LG1g3141 [Vigna unguiculata]
MDPEVAIVEAADPGLIMRALNEYISRGLVLGRRLSAMMQEEIAVGDKKKLADELATLKSLVERDQRRWDDETKKLEAEVKKLKVGMLAAEKKLKLKQVEVDELQAKRNAEAKETAEEISEFLYKEVSVTDCRFNVNLDIYDNKMLDVAEISRLKALVEEEAAQVGDEETLVTTPVNVGGDNVSNEEIVEEEVDVADGENEVVEE